MLEPTEIAVFVINDRVIDKMAVNGSSRGLLQEGDIYRAFTEELYKVERKVSYFDTVDTKMITLFYMTEKVTDEEVSILSQI